MGSEYKAAFKRRRRRNLLFWVQFFQCRHNMEIFGVLASSISPHTPGDFTAERGVVEMKH